MASEPPILNYSPGGGVSSPPVWPPPTNITYPECGRTQLISGQGYIDVVFAQSKPDANWIFTDLQVLNTDDPTPFNIAPGIVTDKTITGFRLQLNGLPNTNSYYLNWSVGGCGTSEWVVQSGVTTFLALTDTPSDYVGQVGKAVKVNATEDGLEFGVVSGGDAGVINVLDYGAVADCVTLFDITMPNGNVVTSAAHTFVAADIGKWAIIRGATDPGGRSPLIAQITAVSGHTATLNTATTSALTNITGTSFPRMDFGTDNATFFTNACFAVPGPGQRNRDFGTPFATTGVMNPILPGDGGTVYIPRGNYLLVSASNVIAGASWSWFFETNNLTLKGDGMGQTVLYITSAVQANTLFGGFAGVHGRFQNVTISDFTMWDLNYYSGQGNTLDVEQVDNLRIERIETVNGKGNGCINVQGYSTGSGPPGTSRVYIVDCWIHGNPSDGNTATEPYGIEGDGMNVGQVRDVHVEGNTITGAGRHGYEGGGNCLDQYFIGNTIDMIGGGASGINPTGGSTTVVMSNTIKNVAAGWYGIDFTVDTGVWVANDIRVIGNYVHGNMQAAFRFQNTSGDTASSHLDRIIVANNWVQGDININTSAIYIGGGDATQTPSMLVTGNWFNNLGVGFAAVGGLTAVTGKYIIFKDNVFAGEPTANESVCSSLIIEGNTTLLGGWNRYGGSIMSCNIDGNNVLTGAIYSNTATGIGYLTTDSVEIIRGATCAPSLIIWGVVTVAGTVTTYAYNPTGGTLNTGAGTKFVVHRAVLV